jgi:ribose transport system permease protein
MEMKMSIKDKIINIVLTKTIFVVIIVVGVIVSVLTGGYFLSWGSYEYILNQISIYGIVSIGMTITIICGEFDLSVSSTYAMCAITFTMVGNATMNIFIAMLAAIGVGALVGVINGVLIAKVKINSFIVTLGMMSIVMGVGQLVSNNQNIVCNLPQLYTLSEKANLFGFNIPFFIFIGLIAGCWFFMSRTKFGRNIYATGGNYMVAALSGIKVDRYKFIVFVILGVCVGVAGMFASIKVSSAAVRLGSDLTLYSITASVIGGASLEGGKGSVVYTFFGVFFMGMMFAAFTQIHILPYIATLIQGAVLILVVYADYLSKNLRSARLAHS